MADRYIYTLMIRDMVVGWTRLVEEFYGIALVLTQSFI